MTMRLDGADHPLVCCCVLASALFLAAPSARATIAEPAEDRLSDSRQPDPSPAGEPPASDSPASDQGATPIVEGSLDALRQAYRAAPIAERVTIADRRGEFTTFDELTVRVHREGEHRTLLVELPSLTIYAESRPSRDATGGTTSHEGRLVVVHNKNPVLAYVVPIDAPLTPALLRRYLRPIPAPAIDLALGDASDIEFLASRVMSWNARAGHADLTLAETPDEPESRATIDLDPRASRPRSFTIRPAPSGPAGAAAARSSLTLRIDPIEPGDPATWTIDPTSRQIVTSLAMLRPLPEPFPLGENFPISTFQTATMLPWSVAEALAPDANLRRVQERYLALVVHALPDDPVERAETLRRTLMALDSCEGVRTRLHQRSLAPEGLGPRRALVRLRAHAIVCLEAPQARRDIILEHARVLAMTRESPSQLLWAGSPTSCLRRLHASEPVAIALLDEQSRLVRVLPVDASASPDSIARDLEAAIMREVNLLAELSPAG